MYRGHTVGVVIPAYNEEGFVGDTIESVPGFVDRVYVVEDGSTDDTWREIQATARAVNERERGADRPFSDRVVAIQHDQNRGVGGAIKTGYLRARDENIDLTAVMGADGQMEPDALADLLDPVVEDRADYVKANRFLGRTDRGEMPAFRFVGNATLGALTKIASGYWQTGDPQSGYTVISRRALDATRVEDMYEFYGYCNDLLVKLNVAGMRVLDVPHPPVYGDEESHIKYHTYIPRVSWMLFRNFLWRLKTKYLAFDFHPLVGAYAAGTVSSAIGVLGLAWALPGVGSVASPLARFGAAMVFLLVGVLAFVAAMWMDREANEHLDDAMVPDKPTAAALRAADESDVARTPAQSSPSPTEPVGSPTRELPSDRAVTVELAPDEWTSLLDAAATDGGDPADAAAARRLRERIRARLSNADSAAD